MNVPSRGARSGWGTHQGHACRLDLYRESRDGHDGHVDPAWGAIRG